MFDTAIRGIINDYFDASFESDGEKMASVFHPQAHIYGHGGDGSLVDMDRDFFAKLVGTPHGDSHTSQEARQDKILSCEFTGENTAVACVQLRVGDTIFTDILSFMCINGKWGVISKLYSGMRQ